MEEENRASYEEAAQLLAQAARLLGKSPAELARYPRRSALREALAPLLEDLAHPPLPPLP
ncbi:MAG: hypothetical protein ACUVUP_02610 [Thermaceae bacterium]